MAIAAAVRASGWNALKTLRRWAAGLSPLALFVFLCSLVGTLYSTLSIDGFDLSHAADDAVRVLTIARCVSLLVMAACSLCFLLGHSVAVFRVCLALKVLALLLYLAEGPYRAGGEVAIVAPLLLEIAIYEAFFLNLLTSLAVAVLSVLASAHPFLNEIRDRALPADGTLVGTLPRYAFFIYLFAFAAIACLLIFYREKCIDQAERMGQLERAVAKLTETNLGYQNYANEASSRSQKEERLRITRELHDIIGYTFTNNIMMLEAAVSKIRKDPNKVRQLITMARANTETGLENVRKTLYLLRSQEPVRVPSANKIYDLVSVFRIATGVAVSVDFANFPNDLDHTREGAFYSFIQQALTNAFRHGAATSIGVQLMRTNRALIAMVSDNGRGAETITEGIGISGMRERLATLGGELRISTMRNSFQIIAEVPYAEDADER